VDPGAIQLEPAAASIPPGAPVEQAAAAQRFLLKLYVSGITPSSARALASLRALCAKHLPGRCDLQVIDVYQQPALAASDGIFATPTLIRMAPLPVKRLTGDLSDEGRVLAGLDILP